MKPSRLDTATTEALASCTSHSCHRPRSGQRSGSVQHSLGAGYHGEHGWNGWDMLRYHWLYRSEMREILELVSWCFLNFIWDLIVDRWISLICSRYVIHAPTKSLRAVDLTYVSVDINNWWYDRLTDHWPIMMKSLFNCHGLEQLTWQVELQEITTPQARTAYRTVRWSLFWRNPSCTGLRITGQADLSLVGNATITYNYRNLSQDYRYRVS